MPVKPLHPYLCWYWLVISWQSAWPFFDPHFLGRKNNMFEYALKNILRRWTRSLLTIGGVAVMMTLIIVITGIVDYQIRTMNAHAAAGSGKIDVQPLLAGTSYPAEGVDLSEADAAALLAQTRDYIQEAL